MMLTKWCRHHRRRYSITCSWLNLACQCLATRQYREPSVLTVTLSSRANGYDGTTAVPLYSVLRP